MKLGVLRVWSETWKAFLPAFDWKELQRFVGAEDEKLNGKYVRWVAQRNGPVLWEHGKALVVMALPEKSDALCI